TVISDMEIDLAWSDNSWNETSFDIWMQDAGVWRSLGTVAAGDTSEPITALSPGTTYSFKVRALNASGQSAFSNVVTATTARTFATVTISSATPSSPLRSTVNSQTTFNAIGVGTIFDGAPP